MVRFESFAILSIGSFAAVVTFTQSAFAGPLDGKWRQGPLREDYTVQQWLPGCGPPPVTGSTGGGESVTVTEEGDELSIVGAGRTFRTNQCYEQMPTLVRDSHSREGSGRSWRTRCSTPASDPRRAVLNTLVAISGDNRLEMSESGRYEITLKEGRCMADVKRSRSYEKVVATPAASATPAAPKTPEPTHAPEPTSRACTTPGEPARLEVRPSRKLLRTGESFPFRAVVSDAKGCATPTPVTWNVEGEGSHLVVDPTGKVTVPEDAPEGITKLVVSAAGKSTTVLVEISSPAHYDALLAQSGLNASGENEETSVAIIAQGALGGHEATAVGNAVRRRNIFIAVVGTLAAVLGLVAIFGWRRARRASKLQREAEARHEQKLREVEERRREKAARHAAQMKAHEESVERAKAVAGARERYEKRLVCPTCHREYGVGSTFCPQDGATLVELAGGEEILPYVAGASARPQEKGKICPTCGDRFDGSASFCGKDGTALVLLN
ncbi:hypothetical protein LVJ94_40635 [Pendulispora rubella]|uniref:Uncharacterized protein n=1 Tax=Pendulispora rubella TaxID=2741070 RepID=A0ABZ2KXA9_9BACT